MKKIIFTLISVAFLMTNGTAQAQENSTTKKDPGHSKPNSTLTEQQIAEAKASLVDPPSTKTDASKSSRLSTSSRSKELQQFSTSDQKEPESLAVPTLLNLDASMSYIITAAVTKNIRNTQSTRSGYYPIYYFYDEIGDLDYVTDHDGTKIADISYCDGSEVYNCPVGWLDWIDFSPLGSHDYLEFYYSQDTPSVNYYAEISSEPRLYFYNMDIANGTSITNQFDVLYDDAFGPRTSYLLSQITGYQEGVTPIDDNWYLWFIFSNNKLSSITNSGNSKTATFQSISSSIYRFWSNAKQGHFFTASASERDGIIANDTSWTYEGPAYSGFSTQAALSTPIYRFWSNQKQHHFFTSSTTEKDSIIANDASWSYEAVAYYAYATAMPNTTPVYRFWSNQKQGHFFTTNSAEKDNIIANDHSWNYEGIAWYVPTN